MEKTDEQMNYENEQLDKMFPDAKFTVAIDIDDIDEIVTELPFIVIKYTYDCYCYDNCKKTTDFFHITGENMTYKYIINNLITQGLNLECNHHFIEGFYKMPNSSCQFEIITGS